MCIGFITSDSVVMRIMGTDRFTFNNNNEKYLWNDGEMRPSGHRVASPPNGKRFHPVGTVLTFMVDRTNSNDTNNHTTTIHITINGNNIPLTNTSDDHSWPNITPDITLIPYCRTLPNVSFEVYPYP